MSLISDASAENKNILQVAHVTNQIALSRPQLGREHQFQNDYGCPASIPQPPNRRARLKEKK